MPEPSAPVAPAVVAVGASAGGVEALVALCAALPPDLPAAVLVVLHVAPTGTSALPAILSRASAMPAALGVDGASIEPGRIYVAPADRHLVVDDGVTRLLWGPRENGHRPAVDPLMRSVAQHYGPRGAGVILSGTRDDGAAGMREINQAGGWTLVQSPETAMYPGMPEAALAATAIDATIPIDTIGAGVTTLVTTGRLPEPTEAVLMSTPQMSEPAEGAGDRLQISCPDCSGVLSERGELGSLAGFECQVGHRYSLESLVDAQGGALEEALWAAIRSLEERSDPLERIAARMSGSGHVKSATAMQQQAAACQPKADIIRRALPSVRTVDEASSA